MIKHLVCLGLLLLLLSGCRSQTVDENHVAADKAFSDFDGITVNVGDLIPAFTLPDGQGEMFSSKSLNKASMLLFYRGDWCPYCISQLEDWQNLLPLLADYNIQLLAISPDDAATTENTARRFWSKLYFPQ